MLRSLCTLLICQIAGEALSRSLNLPVPGPLIGMLILLGWFIYRGGPSAELAEFSTRLLAWLAMLFVPAATGIITGFDVLKADWWRIGIAISISTSVGLAVTAWTMNHLMGVARK
jgi:holin-like protein